jgi:hypothetical protein
MRHRNQTEVFTGTAVELRAEIEARRPYAIAIKEALLRNDISGCEAAQKAMREVFSEQRR